MHCARDKFYCSWDPQLLYLEKNIKNRSHGTIHTFKNYFATMFFNFQFSIFSCIHFILMGPTLFWSHFLSKSRFSDRWSDSFNSLLPRCWLFSQHNEPFKGSTRLQIFLKRIRIDLRFSYQNCHIKSAGLMNVKFTNRIILVLAHRLHWSYILNPKVLLLHYSWQYEFWLMQGNIIG